MKQPLKALKSYINLFTAKVAKQPQRWFCELVDPDWVKYVETVEEWLEQYKREIKILKRARRVSELPPDLQDTLMALYNKILALDKRTPKGVFRTVAKVDTDNAIVVEEEEDADAL